MKKRKMLGIILSLLLGIVIVLIPVDKKGNDDDPEIKDPIDIEISFIYEDIDILPAI